MKDIDSETFTHALVDGLFMLDRRTQLYFLACLGSSWGGHPVPVVLTHHILQN